VRAKQPRLPVPHRGAAVPGENPCIPTRRKHTGKGFTIIEVLVVVAILGILAAIAIPAYTKYVTNARRADGKSALVAAAQAMERYYTNNYAYTNATIGPHDTDTIYEKSDSGYYILSFTTNGVNPDMNRYEIQAVVDPNGKQAGDTLCKTMTINQLGVKEAENDQNADTTDDCWK